MELLVLNTNFESVKLIDSFESLIWTDRYNKHGDFELYLTMVQSVLEYIRQDYYLINKDSDHSMIIESLDISSDVEEGNHLKVVGRSLENILARRIIWGQIIISGNLQTAIESLLNDNIINPEILERKIPNFIFQESTDPLITQLTIEAQFTGDNLYDVIQAMCQKARIGFKIILNETNQFVFSLYAGADRSYNQTTNPFVIFSPNYENLINSSYFESRQGYKNVTLVAGEGEGASRKVAVVGDASGLNRRELFTDARDISSDVGGDTPLTDEEYTQQLIQRGIDNLTADENTEKIGFEGELESTRMFIYGVDFFIGDIIQIENEYGHEGNAYISELVISQDENGTSIFPTFETIQESEE